MVGLVYRPRTPDDCDISTGTSSDCNRNLVPDSCDLASGLASDCNSNQVADDCEVGPGLGHRWTFENGTADDVAGDAHGMLMGGPDAWPGRAGTVAPIEAEFAESSRGAQRPASRCEPPARRGRSLSSLNS